jgi:uncharacterized protein (DUF305 family)
MKDNSLSVGIVGGLVGAALMWVFTASVINTRNTPVMNMMGYRFSDEEQAVFPMGGMGMGSSMTDMMSSLDGRTGDEFDKNFLESMIVHHDGAIEMARLAKTFAKHQEIKDLADDIISAQTSEISKMESWQKSWGY